MDKKATFNSAFVGQNIIEIEQKLTLEYYFFLIVILNEIYCKTITVTNIFCMSLYIKEKYDLICLAALQLVFLGFRSTPRS